MGESGRQSVSDSTVHTDNNTAVYGDESNTSGEGGDVLSLPSSWVIDIDKSDDRLQCHTSHGPIVLVYSRWGIVFLSGFVSRWGFLSCRDGALRAK